MVPRTILKERLTDSILERSCRRIAHSHTDGHSPRQLRVGTDIPVELTITLDGLRGPGPIVGPRETLQGQGRTMVLPVHHILRRIDTPLLHPEEVSTIFVMASINIHSSVMYHWCRVAGAPSLHEGILCLRTCS